MVNRDCLSQAPYKKNCSLTMDAQININMYLYNQKYVILL